MPKVSIIIPVYNAAKPWQGGKTLLDRCIESILAQTYKDFELILVDDGSTDESADVLARYAASDARVHCIHQTNSGVSAARNRGIATARGAWIQFVDADDWLSPDATEGLITRAEESGADMVIADFWRVSGKTAARRGDLNDMDLLTREEYADAMMRNPADYYFGVLWNKLYSREIITRHNMQMDEGLRWCEDFIFNLEYILQVRTIATLHRPIYYYVRTEGSLVAKSMTVGNIVRMKLNVIEYYDRFYRSLFDGSDYLIRKPAIYSYLVSFAGDGIVFPMMPGVHRLPDEAVGLDAASAEPMEGLSRLEQWIHSTGDLLERIAKPLELTVQEFLLLLTMNSDSNSDLKSLSTRVHLPVRTVRSLLDKLALKRLVKVSIGSASPACSLTPRALELLHRANASVEADGDILPEKD